MKLNKKKVTTLALAVCLIATLSFGSLAWFTDADSVTNDFMVAGSDNEDPDEIFSVEVWEEGDDEDDGLEFEDILPGDKLDKVAHVKNTGSYAQYIRVKITVSDAAVWQDVFKANLVPVTEFVNADAMESWNDIYGIGSYLDEENDSFVYYLYYNTPLNPDNKETEGEDEAGDITVFDKAYISGLLDRDQAAALKNDGFQISVHADAVQTEHVGANVYEAFQTVGMEVPVNTTYAEDREALIAAFADENVDFIVMNSDVKCNVAHRITGTNAELYLNGKSLITAPGTDEYGFEMKGDLILSGFGTLTVRASNMQVEGTLTVNDGVTIDGQGRIEDNFGVLIPLE